MKRIFIAATTSLLLAGLSPVFANADWFLSAGVGEQFPQFPNSMTVNNNSGFPPPFSQDFYSTTQSNRPFFLLSGGRRWVRETPWIPAWSLGLEYQYFTTKNVGGTVMQYSSPAFTNYTYHWDLNSNVFLASAKVNLFETHRLSPYLNAGVGGVVNITNHYGETATPGVTAPRQSPNFARVANLRFAYQVGAGVDFQSSRSTIMTLGYLYQDLGNVKSGRGTGSWTSQSLNLGSLHDNAVFLAMTYLFNT